MTPQASSWVVAVIELSVSNLSIHYSPVVILDSNILSVLLLILILIPITETADTMWIVFWVFSSTKLSFSPGSLISLSPSEPQFFHL